METLCPVTDLTQCPARPHTGADASSKMRRLSHATKQRARAIRQRQAQAATDNQANH